MKEKEDIKNYLIIPSVQGLLDCFNTRINLYTGDIGSLCHLIQPEVYSASTVMILGLFSFLYHNCNLFHNDLIEFRTEEFRKFCGYSRGGKSFDIKSELLKLNQLMFCWNGSDAKQAVEIQIAGRTTSIKSLYFKNLVLAMKALSVRDWTTKSGVTIQRHTSSYVSLIKAEIISDSNKSAISIVIEICKLIERRGSHYGGSAHITVGTLIERCSDLRWKIEKAECNSRRNQILRDDFNRALYLIETKTSLYTEYQSASIEVVGKLSVSESGKIEIRHKGKKATITIRKERKLKYEGR